MPTITVSEAAAKGGYRSLTDAPCRQLLLH